MALRTDDDDDDDWCCICLWVFHSMCILCRYFCVHIASPADELSRERRHQTQGAAQEAAGRLLRQVRFFSLFLQSLSCKESKTSPCNMEEKMYFFYILASEGYQIVFWNLLFVLCKSFFSLIYQEYSGQQLWNRHPLVHQ